MTVIRESIKVIEIGLVDIRFSFKKYRFKSVLHNENIVDLNILTSKSVWHSGVSRISFRGGFKIFLEKWGYLHGAKRHAARGEAMRLLGGFGGMLPRENFKKWCNLVHFREYFA